MWNPSLDPAYLREHARQPVRFADAVSRLVAEGYDTFLELGPSPTLGGAIRAASGTATTHGRRARRRARALLETVGTRCGSAASRSTAPPWTGDGRASACRPIRSSGGVTGPRPGCCTGLVLARAADRGRGIRAVAGLAEALETTGVTILTSGDVTASRRGRPTPGRGRPTRSTTPTAR